MKRNLAVTALVALLMAGFVLALTALQRGEAQPGPGMGGNAMGGMGVTGPAVPPVKGFTEGAEIRFIHTEASDPQVAQMLTDMTLAPALRSGASAGVGSPVLVVPSLAEVPAAARANVYVFKNGLQGEGPFGFQPDVFDNPPGTAGYSPLRAVNLVTWVNEAEARALKSAAEVREAEAKGRLTIERPGVVVNMPLLTWPGGQR